MERLRIIILALLIAVASYGQTAKEVLDKAAAAVSNKSGITASFTLKGGQMNDKGTINIKGKKFQIMTPDVIIWFDGKTQWSYIRKNDEVNMSNPNESQLQALNPYNFIYMYKKGYNSTLAKKGNNYEVHLTATDKKGLCRRCILPLIQKPTFQRKSASNIRKVGTPLRFQTSKRPICPMESSILTLKTFPQQK